VPTPKNICKYKKSSKFEEITFLAAHCAHPKNTFTSIKIAKFEEITFSQCAHPKNTFASIRNYQNLRKSKFKKEISEKEFIKLTLGNLDFIEHDIQCLK
jgi:hypothetical protein